MAIAATAPAAVRADERLPVLARVGPWPVISRLVGYAGRLWFANSVKGRNHNSADIYSFDPAAGRVRYERHLFSQDAGRPLVAGGRLYWPFEDPRFSLGWGHYAVTDGRSWALGTIPSARIFHVHAMVEWRDGLLAATSAWRAGLQMSGDGGTTWRRLYDHPTAAGRVSRITELVRAGDRVFGQLVERGESQLVEWNGAAVAALPGWPRGRSVVALAARRGWLYGLLREGRDFTLWRSDGQVSERIALPRRNWITLAAGDDGLWALSREGTGGLLWRRGGDGEWQPRHELTGGLPLEVAIVGGRAYVAGEGDDGRGILWGPRGPPIASATSPVPLPGPSRAGAARDWAAAGVALDRLLADPDAYRRHGEAIRNLVYELAGAGPPAGFLASRLLAPLPCRKVHLIGGAVTVPAASLARWILLWGMGLSGRGQVPLRFITEPWRAPANDSEKYFEAAPVAMWAAAAIGQRDRQTIAALVARLDRTADPDWLRGDAVGALTALTGRRLGYDAAAWRAWWEGAEQRLGQPAAPSP